MFREVLSIRYVVVGGQATRHYMPERMTLDWDLLISSDDAERAKADLQAAGAHTFRPLTIPGFSCRMPDGLLVDVLEGDADWLPSALARAWESVSGNQDPVLALPYLTLLKLQSSRVQDLADISRMMACASPESEAETLAVVAAHLPDAVEDLRSLAELGKRERQDREG